MPQLAQCLGFDLADTLAGDGECLAHLFERVLAAVLKTEPHLDDFLFAWCKRFQHRRYLFHEAQVRSRI